MIYTNRPWRPAAARAKRVAPMTTTNDDALVDRLARALARTDVRADGPTVDRVQRALRDMREDDFENVRHKPQKKTATPYEVWRAAQTTAQPKKAKVLDARARRDLVQRLDAANKQRTENAERRRAAALGEELRSTPFAPQLNARSLRSTRPGVAATSTTHFQRREAKAQKVRERRHELERRECTFAPTFAAAKTSSKIYKRARGAAPRTPADRAAFKEAALAKTERMRQRQEAAEVAQTPFAPRLNGASMKIAASLRASGACAVDPRSRTTTTSPRRTRRVSTEEAATFAPQISERAKRYAPAVKDVHNRLYAKTEARFPRSPRGAAAPEPAPVAVLAYGRDVDEILGLVATAFRPRPPPGEAWT